MRKIKLVESKWSRLLVKLANNFSDNPLKLWVLNSIKAKLELKDPNTIIRVKNITYSEEMIEIFDKQIPKLLKKSLIKDNISPYSSLVFIVINHVEPIREKNEWLWLSLGKSNYQGWWL